MALPYEPPSPAVRPAPTAKPVGRKPVSQKAAPTSLLQTALDAALAPVNTAGYTKLANAQAKATIASQLAAYHAQQAQALAQARNQAQQIGLASQSAADYLAPLGDKTAQDWANAVQAQAGIAQGFTGQLRSDAEQAAQQAQAQIAGSGSGAQANDQSASLANLLYGLSGQLPANVLTAQGLGETQAARALPGQTLAYGQQEAVGALGQGNLAAQQFAPDIAKAIGSQPGLAAQYLSDLTKQATDAQQNRADALFKAVTAQQSAQNAASLQAYRNRPQLRADGNGGIISVTSDGKVTQVSYGPQDLHSDGKGGTIAVNPYTGKITQVTQGAPTLRSDGKGGVIAVDSYTGKISQVSQGAATVRSDGSGGLVSVDPYTGQITQVKDGPINWQRVTDATGTYIIDASNPASIRKIKVAGPPGSSARANQPKLVTAPDGSKVIVRSNPDGSLTFQNAPGKLGQPKASAASSIPQGLLRSAEKIAQIAHDGTFDSVGNQIIPPQKNRAVALRRVMATLRAGGVKRKDAVRVAPAILIGAGYPPPQPKGVHTAGVGSAVTDWVAALTGQPVPNPTPGNLFG